jgi:hypothetical protein
MITFYIKLSFQNLEFLIKKTENKMNKMNKMNKIYHLFLFHAHENQV